uniref:Uncharacterized protein n=1 Tax=Physcomitrium patens TaxID=3218 RepID=A9SBI4_PHYPA|nr:hypothetical protein PHYPA_000766 [Physcomitrium patens]
MTRLHAITYGCYITAIMVQGVLSMGFILDPLRMVHEVTDIHGQFFIRVTGICLLFLTQFFWGFRHVPFQASNGFDSQMASYSHGCARMFTKFHFLISLLLLWSKYSLGLNMTCGPYLLSMHLMWTTIMTYALLEHRRNVRGFIIDTSSVPAAAKSLAEMIKGRDEPPTMLEYLRGDDSSSTSVLQTLKGLPIPCAQYIRKVSADFSCAFHAVPDLPHIVLKLEFEGVRLKLLKRWLGAEEIKTE